MPISSNSKLPGSNIALNLYGIPRYGAMAAAINTLISYFVYLGMLAWTGGRASSASSITATTELTNS